MNTMNTMKKCLALCLTLVLLVSMAAGAMAATLKLPAGLTEVEEQAFAGSAALDRVILPEGVKSIGSQAFASSSLTSINLPRSLTSIADDAFANSPNVKATVKAGSYAMTYCAEQGVAFEVESVALPSDKPAVSISANKTSVAAGEGMVKLTFTRDDGKAVTKTDRIGFTVFYLNSDDEVIMTDGWSLREHNGEIEIGFQCAGARKVIISINENDYFSPGKNASVELKLTGSSAYDYCDFSVYGQAYPGGKVLVAATLRNPDKIETAQEVTVTTPTGTVVSLGKISASNPVLTKEIRIPTSWEYYDEEGNEREYELKFKVGDYTHYWYVWIEPMTEQGIGVPVGETYQLEYRKIPSLMPYAFTVADSKIATVDAYGNVTGVKAGKTTGTMTTNIGQKYTFEIVVRDAEGGSTSQAPVFYVAAPKAQMLHGNEDQEIFRIYSDVEDSLYLDEEITYLLSFYDENNNLVSSFEEYRYINTGDYVNVWADWQYWDNRVGKPYRYVEFSFGDIDYEVIEPSTARVEVISPEELGMLGFKASANYGTYTAGDKVEIEITCTTPELLASFAAVNPVKVVPLCQNGAFDIIENVKPAVFNADTKSAVMSFTVSDKVIPGEGFYVPFYCGTKQVGYYSLMIHSGLSRQTYNTTLAVGERSKLPVSIAEGADWNNVYFDVYDSSILTVDTQGYATGLKAGETEIEIYYETSYGIVDSIWINVEVYTAAEGELPVLTVTPLTTTAVYGEPIKVRVQLSGPVENGDEWLNFRLTMSVLDKYGDVLSTYGSWKDTDNWSKLLGEGMVFEVNRWPTDDDRFAVKYVTILPGYTDDHARYTLSYNPTKIPVTGVPERGEIRYGISAESTEYKPDGWAYFEVWRLGETKECKVELREGDDVLATTTLFKGSDSISMEIQLDEDDFAPLSQHTIDLYVDGEKVEGGSYTFTVAEPQLYFSNAPTRMGLDSSYPIDTYYGLDGYTCEVTMTSSDPSVAGFDANGHFTAYKTGTCTLTASCAHQTISRKVTVFDWSGTVVPELYFYSLHSTPLYWQNSCKLGVGIIGDLQQIPAHAVDVRMNIQILDGNQNVVYDAVQADYDNQTLYCSLESSKTQENWYDHNIWVKMVELDGRYFRFTLLDSDDGSYTVDKERNTLTYELRPASEIDDPVVKMTYPNELAAGEVLNVTFTCLNPSKIYGGMQIMIASEWDESTALVTGVLTKEAPSATLSYTLPADFQGDSFCVGYMRDWGMDFDSFWLNLKQ